MGHRKSIVRQAVERLQAMASWGQSKHQDKAANGGKPAIEKIYSHSTMDNYKDAAVHFAKWAREVHGCRDIDKARQYTGEYLQTRKTAGLSAWTVRRDAAALGKLYQCKTTDLGAELPARHRGDVTQHRTDAHKGHFSESKHKDLVDFCRGTGLRRHEVAALRPDQAIRMPDGSVMLKDIHGKGGRVRNVPVRPQYANHVIKMAQEAVQEGRSTVFEHISKYAPCHFYRAEYARDMYAELARDTATLPRSEVYCGRADLRGKSYDKVAMQAVSLALGHSKLNGRQRLDVVTSYLK